MCKRTEEIIEQVVSIIVETLSPRAVFLFGSRAKETHAERADFDIAVDAENPSAEVRQTIKEQLDSVSGLYSVDVVFMGEVDDAFRQIIYDTGRCLYEQ